MKLTVVDPLDHLRRKLVEVTELNSVETQNDMIVVDSRSFLLGTEGLDGITAELGETRPVFHELVAEVVAIVHFLDQEVLEFPDDVSLLGSDLVQLALTLLSERLQGVLMGLDEFALSLVVPAVDIPDLNDCRLLGRHGRDE